MADIYVWSGAATPTAGANWETAYATITAAAASMAAGVTVYVAHDHNENAGTVSFLLTGGTVASPVRVICGTRSGTTGTGISGLATTGVIKSSTTTFAMSGVGYFYGLTFEQTSNSTTSFFIGNSAGSVIIYDTCNFICTGTGSSTKITTGPAAATTMGPMVFNNCTFKFAVTGQHIAANGYVEFNGGASVGSTSPTNFITVADDSRGGVCRVNGFDFSTWNTTFNIFGVGSTTSQMSARNCKMPASWTGNIGLGSLYGTKTSLINYTVGTGDTNYKFVIGDGYGSSRDDATIYRDGGAADESPTPYSMKMISTANVSWPAHVLKSPPIIVRQITSSNRILTVHVAHNGTLSVTDADLWLEVEYFGTSGYTLPLYANDRCALNVAAQAQPDSGASWTGDAGAGSTNDSSSTTWHQITLDSPVITFQETGYAIVTVCLAKPSWTVWVDPKVVIS